ncbi:unnamed protein product, partial [Pocillopora meandrina]
HHDTIVEKGLFNLSLVASAWESGESGHFHSVMNMPPPGTEKSFHSNLGTNSKRQATYYTMVVSPCGS